MSAFKTDKQIIRDYVTAMDHVSIPFPFSSHLLLVLTSSLIVSVAPIHDSASGCGGHHHDSFQLAHQARRYSSQSALHGK